ncbi:Leu/Phe-tRNA protein transferase, putative [Plasmodium ovale wallikeri]|uniref:Leu/Phe-tRNA protein transferase, putative n=2 Tax=Plasmodium ovale TaxID=36330 RepID=A0A1A8YJY8_PLAOA|nr:Leu/Phe-tRNA protein transferase, putative [Plasmodium ovale wallikeri]SBT32196.1 Leu/Phe-tRNA protein transferase, putative [Plasmodium ovale wallikeri]SBT75663.1 Leu/Phe-tRNA protein transferase, putative [Plasmodium ovale]
MSTCESFESNVTKKTNDVEDTAVKDGQDGGHGADHADWADPADCADELRDELEDDVNINKIVKRMAIEDPEALEKVYKLIKSNSCLKYYPLLTPYHNIKKTIDILIKENYEHENTWCVHCDARFICQLFYEGFIPVASKQKSYKMENDEIIVVNENILIPKLHYIRSCMHPSEIHISKKVKKKCKNFYVTINKDFDGVIKGIVEKHGHNWVYPFIQNEFKKIYNRTVTYKNVQLHSVELWHDNELVAGEIGNTVGSIYTSLTGFQRRNCAGTIQLCALAKILEQQNFQLWDLGMLLPYKKEIGSKEIPMKEFFDKHRAFKHQHAEFKVPFTEKLNCSTLIKGPIPNEG